MDAKAPPRLAKQHHCIDHRSFRKGRQRWIGLAVLGLVTFMRLSPLAHELAGLAGHTVVTEVFPGGWERPIFPTLNDASNSLAHSHWRHDPSARPKTLTSSRARALHHPRTSTGRDTVGRTPLKSPGHRAITPRSGSLVVGQAGQRRRCLHGPPTCGSRSVPGRSITVMGVKSNQDFSTGNKCAPGTN